MGEPRSIEPDVSAEHPISADWVWVGPHRPAVPRALFDQMTRDWGPEPLESDRHPAADRFAERRARVAEAFSGRTVVVPSGHLKVRANDTHFRFRPGTEFFYLSGCFESDAVLVIGPDGSATLYVPERRDRSTHEFFTDATYGELWVGRRRGVDEAAQYYGVDTAPLDQLDKDLASLSDEEIAVLRGYDEALDDRFEESEASRQLAELLSELRLVKDEWELAQLQEAIDATVRGFEDVVRALESAIGRGERVIEGVFNLRARVEGNDVGYGTIAASGAHATILHWTTNDGVVREGDLLLLDAGVECDQLYTADVTRTMPVSGTFTRPQREIYELVRKAQDAAIAAVRPGAKFRDPHEAAMAVIVDGLVELGIMEGEPAEILRKDRQLHRRYTLHGVSHMLGLDVHDCAHARNETYYEGELKEGYVLTVEPGIYFQANDLTVAEEYRGIGVRIEDDVLVTADGCRVLSDALPRTADDVETWMASLRTQGPTRLGL